MSQKWTICQNVGIPLDNRRGIDLRTNNNIGNSDRKMGNGTSMSSRQMGTWCQNAIILLDNRRGMDLRANNNFGNSEGKMENELLCLVDRWGLGLSL